MPEAAEGEGEIAPDARFVRGTAGILEGFERFVGRIRPHLGMSPLERGREFVRRLPPAIARSRLDVIEIRVGGPVSWVRARKGVK